MQKGISPIVAVVLLIAIAVIAAVGLYFWVGGLATQQPTPSKPIVLSAQGLTCGGVGNTYASSPRNGSLYGAVTVMVQNLDPANPLNAVTLYVKSENATSSASATISAGQQTVLSFSNNDPAWNLSQTYVIYGISGVSQAQFVCQNR